MKNTRIQSSPYFTSSSKRYFKQSSGLDPTMSQSRIQQSSTASFFDKQKSDTPYYTTSKRGSRQHRSRIFTSSSPADRNRLSFQSIKRQFLHRQKAHTRRAQMLQIYDSTISSGSEEEETKVEKPYMDSPHTADFNANQNVSQRFLVSQASSISESGSGIQDEPFVNLEQITSRREFLQSFSSCAPNQQTIQSPLTRPTDPDEPPMIMLSNRMEICSDRQTRRSGVECCEANSNCNIF